jgi:hypothetical protein
VFLEGSDCKGVDDKRARGVGGRVGVSFDRNPGLLRMGLPRLFGLLVPSGTHSIINYLCLRYLGLVLGSHSTSMTLLSASRRESESF